MKQDWKIYAFVGAGLTISGIAAANNISEYNKRVMSLPVIEGNTPVTLSEFHCKDKLHGEIVPVFHNDQQFRLTCP